MIRSTKIVATLGPSSSSPEILEQMFRAGVDVVRINFSHGAAEDHLKRAEMVREICRKTGRTVGIMGDLQGPKIRVGKFRDGKVTLKPGDAFILDADCELGDEHRAGLDYKELPQDVKPGDVLLLDDGLQHYRLARDIEIAVEDGRGAGNGMLLPAGPLREPASRRVDAWVMNAAPIGTHAPSFRMDLRGDAFRRLRQPQARLPASALAGKKLHAVAGIGNPQRFFDQLAQLGLASVNHAFPDHHAYAAAELDFGDCEALLMTEKDAVKCEAFAREHWYALQVEAELAPAFFDFILAKLNGLKTA